MEKKVIYGDARTSRVWIGELEVDLQRSLRMKNKSPSGFAWGYYGSGPAQLALAILLELYDEDIADRLHQQLKQEFIAQHATAEDLVLPVAVVKAWVEQQLERENNGQVFS